MLNVFLDEDGADEVGEAEVGHQEAVGDTAQPVPLPVIYV